MNLAMTCATPAAGSETMLRSLQKGFDVETARRTAELARESGIRCPWFFLLGGPRETRATFEETLFVCRNELNWKKFLTIFMTGIRILPGPDLARHEVAEKYLAADHDQYASVFYVTPGLDEQWVLDHINRAIARSPTIVHGAEQSGSRLTRAFNSALYWLGAAPPFYRFLPDMLRCPPRPTLRARHTGVRAAVRTVRGNERALN